MTILLVGLNHRTAPVELREKLSLSGEGLITSLHDFATSGSTPYGDPAVASDDLPPALREVVILSTCNRMEIYAVTRHIGGGRAAIDNFLSRLHGIPMTKLKPHLYFMHGQDAVTHLMRVTSGLDSMILGEAQILGQVACAFTMAQEANTTGATLSHLFNQALHAGKRARTETDISQHNTSVSHAAALLAQDRLGDLAKLNILLVGAGEMAKVAAHALVDRGAQNLMCINRTFASAETLANQFNGRAIAWHGLPEALCWADVVVSATGAPHTILHESDVRDVLPQRNDLPIIFIDIAVPRDIEESVGLLDTVDCYDIDDLQSTLDENMAQREAAVPHVENIVSEEASSFAEWLSSREVAPVIADLRTWATDIVRAEVDQTINRLGDISNREKKLVERLAHRIVNKMLHNPTTCLREQAANGHGYAYAHVVRELFSLGEVEAYDPSQHHHHSQHETSSPARNPHEVAVGD